MRLAISVIAMTAAKARTGDGPWYGSSVRRVPSIAWEPVALQQPDREQDQPGEEQPRGRGRAAREHRHEDDGEAEDGPDPADEVERRDRAPLEAERRRARRDRLGVRRGRLGQGSGIVPGAPRLADGGWRTRPDLVLALARSAGAGVVDGRRSGAGAAMGW